MFNWIVSDTLQYLELLNFVDLSNIYVQIRFGIYYIQWFIYYKTETKPNIIRY